MRVRRDPFAESGERVALSREQVVTTAVDLLRRYGLGDLSMRRLARELGVAPGALYWHVANKQELLVEVAEVLLAEIVSPPADQPAADALVGLAVAVREALVVHHILGSVAGQQDRALAASVDPDLPAPDATTEAKAFEVGLSVIVRGLARSR